MNPWEKSTKQIKKLVLPILFLYIIKDIYSATWRSYIPNIKPGEAK